MSERMLVTQALDERDLLVKRIAAKIQKASFVDTIKHNEEKVLEHRILKEDFCKQAEASWQQIMDLTDRFQKIDAAIVASNASTWLDTSYGKLTVAGAISLRSRLKGRGTYGDDADFESNLCIKLQQEYHARIQIMEKKNMQLQSSAEELRRSIFGKENCLKGDTSLDVMDAYIRGNTTELVDPLNVQGKMSALLERKAALLKELDTCIKVSNATTYIEI